MLQKSGLQWGPLDYLVNNAFSFTAKGLDVTRADWERVMNVGPVAYATMGQLCYEHMKKQGTGAIVNMSSISAHIAQPDRWTYNAAKGGGNPAYPLHGIGYVAGRAGQYCQSRLDLDA